MTRWVPITLGVAVAVIAVVALRAATMAVPTPPVHGDGLALVLDGEPRYDEQGAEPRRQHQTVALAQLCALRVGAGLVDESTRTQPDGDLEVLVRPAVQGVAQDELEGCIEDLRVRRLLVHVESMRQVELPPHLRSAQPAVGSETE